MANLTTIATKVRILILEAIAKRHVTGEQGMFVKHFVSRPVLLIRTREAGMVKEIGLTFVDALKKYGKELVAGDLAEAYDKAGNSFVGQMQQTFVVLHEGITQARIKFQKKKTPKKEQGKTGKFRSGFGSGVKPKKGKGK